MDRHVAFLRGMNLGGRRLTNEELCGHMAALGLTAPTAFLASGNVVFDVAGGTERELRERVSTGLEAALGYPVPTFVRGAAEVLAIAGHQPFPAGVVERSGGKLQVALLPAEPSPAARDAVLAHATGEDRLALVGRELYWLPNAGILDTALDLAALEKTVGPWTMRTKRTIERLAAKFLGA